MVVSVKRTKGNPYFSLFEERNGFLEKSKEGNFERRQDCPEVFEFNGAIYIINVKSLAHKSMAAFDKIIKFEMNEFDSLDIDTELDFKIAEALTDHVE